MFKKINQILIFLLILATPLQMVGAAFFPNDTYYHNQWYLEKIKADDAWEKINSSPNIVIAIIDSGIQISHPDLAENIFVNQNEIVNNGLDDDHNGFIDDVSGWDFVANVPDPSPKFSVGFNSPGVSHGTMVAGIIGARGNNGFGVAGVTWKSKIMALKALDDSGSGRMGDVIRAIDYAINNGADIINLSFTAQSYSEGLKEALERAYRAGVIVVAASGNDQSANHGVNIDKTPFYPACYDGDNGENLVIGVAATDTMDQKAIFSSYGSNCIDISAPGVSFFGTLTYNPAAGEEYNKSFGGYWSGTSMATPLVSGTLALIKEANPNLSRDEITNILLRSTDNINNFNPDYIGKLGVGRLNMMGAVSWAKERLNDYSGRLIVSPYMADYSSKFKNTEEHQNKVQILSPSGQVFKEFLSDNNKYKEGLKFASGDVTGDGASDIVVANGYFGQPVVRVFDAKGKIKSQFLAYNVKTKSGINVAVGDIDGDQKNEIITTPGFGAEPMIKIFDYKGKLKKQFLAYDQKFKGGVNVAVGDMNGDGISEIVVAPGFGGGPHVRIFDGRGRLKGQFMVYDQKFKGGVNLTVANIDGRVDYNKAEIIISPMEGASPLVKIFDNYGQLKSQFMAYDNKFKNGVNIAAGDINRDGLAEIITGAGPGGAPHVRVFSPQGEILESFYAYQDTFNKGVSVGFILMDN
ncbi:hypothetical protein COT98_04640 [Candidatus Falkowbacteria bacterium CG10_big_fil_rev_8_21_14_0_10_39_9]|uniref:Peptidase S8/S53 domain-containing protein n=1 Tax=Candidatus Falkowbacteria bacterium CG10_big_fil_rev_8_21_14_0_10_39_9 TaxID=1974566 RepID=A0A2M6WNA7_9BACT|nr:MAG: hypothetical protein COT98_04640 [Candidatus Falkowbacteria bacterium CG10_big_fil_rev_8_21_14_0_10_39_9]